MRKHQRQPRKLPSLLQTDRSENEIPFREVSLISSCSVSRALTSLISGNSSNEFVHIDRGFINARVSASVVAARLPLEDLSDRPTDRLTE